MLESPDAVLLYIPLMKELGMAWSEIKNTPRYELDYLLAAAYDYQRMHSMDGYDDKDINEMAKDKPQIRQSYTDYLTTRRKYEDMIGKERKLSFKGI